MLNVAAGGSSFQDLEQENGAQNISMFENSSEMARLSFVDLLEREIYVEAWAKNLNGYFFTNQAVKNIGKVFEASARVSDGV